MPSPPSSPISNEVLPGYVDQGSKQGSPETRKTEERGEGGRQQLPQVITSSCSQVGPGTVDMTQKITELPAPFVTPKLGNKRVFSMGKQKGEK